MNISIITLCSLGRTVRISEHYILLVLLLLVGSLFTSEARSDTTLFALFTFNGDSVGERLGFSVSGAGDVNGDGFADVIVGAIGDDNNAPASGSASIFSGLDGSVLFTFNGDSDDDLFGFPVSGAGDINGDGLADVIVGASRDDNNGSNSGSARVFLFSPICGPDIGDNSFIGSESSIGDNTTIGDNINIGDDTFISEGVNIGEDANIGQNANIAEDANIGEGATCVASSSAIGETAVIGAGSTIGDNSPIGENSVIGSNVNILNDVMIGENVTIGNRVIVGDGATIVDGVTIGACASIVAGASITVDVPPVFPCPVP